MKEHRERSPKRGLGLVLLALLLFFGVPDFSTGDTSFPDSIPSIVQSDDGDGSEASQDDSSWSDDDSGDGTDSGSDAGQSSASAAAVNPEGRDLDDPVFYVRSQLNKDDREAYDLMYQALVQRDEVSLDLGSPDELVRIRDCVLADHPEIFYTKGISYRGSAESGYLVSGTYTHSEDSARDAMDMIEMVADECLRGLPPGADDYETAKYVYEYIIDNTTYGDALSDGQTIENVLIDKQAVCAGYASTFQYLMQSLGFPCIYVTGDAGEAHAWCAVMLDGDWYLVDPTWGDPLYGSSGEPGDRLSYKYLCITDADISATHTDLSPYDVPQCAATKDNYYVREGLYFESADVARAGNLIGAALDGGAESIEIRCASRDVYDELRSQLIDGGKIYDYISANSYSYTTEEHMLVLGFLPGSA